MFRLNNLRKFTREGWTYLSCDFNVEGMRENPFTEETMWVAVEERNADMLADNVYDPFVLVPVILGMYYGQDVRIEGNVSPRLYHNVKHYLMNIFDRFSDRTRPVEFSVDGFDTVQPATGGGGLIGTGISCGVDSMVTIYDNFINETDPNFRINSLFLVNCGTHGDYESEFTQRRYRDRVELNRGAAEELGLPMYLVNSNYHAFTHRIGEQPIGYLAIYSCVLSLQRYIKRYYTSSNLSYDEIAEFSKLSRDFDIAEYSESFMPHLISTERFELVIDGCQYTRAEKTERISDWEFAQKHLNVCVPALEHARNCSCCNKCMWTLIPLEAMGKLEQFSQVFDLDVYRKNAPTWKLRFAAHEGTDAMETSIIRYARAHGMELPSRSAAARELKWRETVRPRLRRALRKVKSVIKKPS